MLLFWVGKKPEVQPVPHAELTPLTEEECAYPTFERNPMLSRRDYSSEEIERAKGPIPMDMREYCYNNGISWEKQIVRKSWK
jgi:hypothetical protein